MKKFLLVCLFLVISVGSAYATSFNDVDSTIVLFKEGGTVTYTWSFDLPSDTLATGTIDGNDIITSAYVGWNISGDTSDDKGWQEEYVDLTVNGVKLLDDWEVDNNIGWYMNKNLVVGGSTFDFSVTFDDYRDGWNCGTEDGGFSDITISDVRIFGEYTAVPNGTNPVPEPATMLLFGLGLLGLAGVNRKKQ
jgi:hypothetical protein